MGFMVSLGPILVGPKFWHEMVAIIKVIVVKSERERERQR